MYQSPEKKESHCWLDRTLHKQFISYHNSLDAKVGLDYLTGEITKLGNRFPRKLRPLPGGDQTTLISANNALVFTGLFQTKEEALSIGIENAYKVFNTLKWLLQTTGKLYGTMAVAVWNVGDYPIPEWDKDTINLHMKLKTLPMKKFYSPYDPIRNLLKSKSYVCWMATVKLCH